MEDMMQSELLGPVLGRGKTKIIHATDDSCVVDLEATADITAGDGKKHDQMEGKPQLATQTTCNVFRALNNYGLPTSFIKQVNPTTFRAWKCNMIPYEVVVRLEADGSALERDPKLTKYHVFETPVVEFFLKTTAKQWRGIPIPVDDPYVLFQPNDRLELHDPHEPLNKPFLVIDEDFSYPDQRRRIAQIADQAAACINFAWKRVGGRLIDIKFEFGMADTGALLLADVVDNDSWRVVYLGDDVSKQSYRDGQSLPTVKGKYELVAQLTDQF